MHLQLSQTESNMLDIILPGLLYDTNYDFKTPTD